MNELNQAKHAPKLPQSPIAFVFYFIRFFSPLLIAMVILEAGQSASHILLPYAVKQIIDGVQNIPHGASNYFQALKDPLWLFVGLNIGVLLFSRASGACLVIVGPALRRKVRFYLYNYLQYHSQRYFMSHFAGSLANRITEVAMSVGHTLWTVLFDFWPIFITFSVSLVLLHQAHSGLAYVLGAWIFAFVLASYFLAKKCRRYAKDFAAARSAVTGKIVDAVTNIQNSKLFARLSYERTHLSKYLTLEVDSARRTYWFMERMRWFQFTAALVLQVSIIFYAFQIWTQGEITVGEFAMVTSLSLLIIGEARNLSRRFLEFFEYVGNISDGVSIIVKSHEIVDQNKAKPIEITKGMIQFENVHFQYSQGIEVFSGLHVEIKPGERVGLVGFSGSGKSTFVNLILRFFDLDEGKILIDGQNIKEFSQDSLRSQVSMIPQDPMLFHRSLMENIRYGKIDASDEEVIEAAQKAHAHEFIMQVNEKYNALVGERGVKLSGGQRQRIAIARAILKNAPILLMDEATSSLDSVTEKAIQESLVNLMKDKTVVVIAHRLSTISHLDRILVFHQGKIIEEGSHDVLLAKKGHYAHLWSMQAGGFLPEADLEANPEDEDLSREIPV